MTEPLVLSLVGHTNVGKTSLVSALTRDADLQIEEAPGTTTARYRRVYSLDGQPVLAFVDTPGFEMAARVNRWLDKAAADDGRLDGRQLIEAFIGDEASDERFAAEKEALRGALEADVLAYVADAHEEPSGQKRQELRLLRRAGVPMIGVLNFVGDSDQRESWFQAFRREGIDNHVLLDAHAFPADQEARLYAVLRQIRHEQAALLEQLTGYRERERGRLRGESARVIAELLVDCLAHQVRLQCDSEDEAKRRRGEANDRFKNELRSRERAAFAELAALHRFSGLAVGADPLDVQSWSGEWQGDLFDTEQWGRYVRSTLSWTAIGTAVAAVIDLSGGLGAATLLGTLAGAGFGLWRGRRQSTRVQARQVSVGPVEDKAFPSVVANRALELRHYLAQRSHARRDDVAVRGGSDRLGDDAGKAVDRVAARIRRHPDWSRIGGGPSSPERARAVDELAVLLAPRMDSEGP